MADVSQIKLPNGTTYTLKDEGALQLTGGNVTGPVSFGDSVSIDDLNAGQLVVSGSASVANNLQVNTINGVTVGSSPKFTDNNTTYSAGTGLSLSSTTFSVKLGYTTSGNNRAVQADSSGNLYVTQKDDNNNTFKSFYGTCDTAAATAAKVVTLSVTTGWQLAAGTVVGIKFTNTNTAANPTLNVNSSGAKSIFVNNAVLTTGNWYAGEAGRVHYYMYDGTYWVFMGHSYDWNSDLKVTQTNSTTNADYRVLLSANANDTTETNTSFKNTNLRYNPSTGTLKIKGFDSISSNFKSINCDVSKSEVTAQNSSLTTSSADTDWFQALVKAICIKYPNITNTVFRGTISPNSHKYYEIFIYDTSTIDSTTKLPQHSFGRALNYGGGFTKFGTDSYVWRFGNVDTNTNTTYSAGTGLSLSSTTFSVKLGYTTSGNNRAVQADSSGNLYVTQKDTNTDISTLTLAEDTGTSAITLAHGGKYKLTAGTKTVIFTMPASGNTDTKVAITAVTPASETTNYVLTHTSTSGTTGVEAHAYNRYWYKQGSTSVNGYVYAGLGNNIATGTANNSQGYVRLYGPNTGYGNITYANATANSTHTLPSTGGTILNTGTTSFTQSLTSGTKVGTIKINGTETILYAPTNTNTTYSAGTGLSLSSTTFSLATSGVTAGSYGAVNNTETTLSGHSTIYELGITVDKYGRVTDVKAKPKNIFSGDILCAHAASSTSTTIPKSTITQIPLTQTLVSRDYHSNLSLASNRIAIANAGTYRITGSIYMSTTAASTVGVYIMKGTGAFSSATEITSSYIYIGIAGTTSINVTKTIEAAAGTYIYLAARASNGGTVASGNTATYLEVEELRF